MIFDFDESAELRSYFQCALQSNSRMFVETVLRHLIRKNIWVTDDQILTCFEINYSWIDAYYYQILTSMTKSPDHTERLIRLFHTARTDSIKIAVAECMESFATQGNYMNLIPLLENSTIAKIRMEACRIANKYERYDLLQNYVSDPDGHIRKYVKKVLHL